jgi:hypothetical protein
MENFQVFDDSSFKIKRQDFFWQKRNISTNRQHYLGKLFSAGRKQRLGRCLLPSD